jgi:hypothetical protein
MYTDETFWTGYLENENVVGNIEVDINNVEDQLDATITIY